MKIKIVIKYKKKKKIIIKKEQNLLEKQKMNNYQNQNQIKIIIIKHPVVNPNLLKIQIQII